MTPLHEDPPAAERLMEAHTPSLSLRTHMRAVSTAMAWFARQGGYPESLWRVTGLLHDFDYEQHPAEHPMWGVTRLKELGLPEDACQAILAHADYTGEPRETPLAKTLYAVDELCGLLVAAVLVRPARDFEGLEVKSVMKKFRDKAFAKGVNREDVRNGAQALGLSLETLVEQTLTALKQARFSSSL